MMSDLTTRTDKRKELFAWSKNDTGNQNDAALKKENSNLGVSWGTAHREKEEGRWLYEEHLHISSGNLCLRKKTETRKGAEKG